ncbi:hypothetical protein BXZ70DRAFT_932499 [Cristinia sonorae]|uniref:RBR-type E3 ubiquitin transferase n=1 Tax=Cristinia sonorae TaxID=1940300 RepID=A0A8K0XRK8_9AGAR|nr:hypothetical protein BXZ70DRAFT_932499 [Cristinia sonorae]
MSADVLSELLIAQLLEEDMRVLTSQQEAENLQLAQSLADSAGGNGRIPKRAAKEPIPDMDYALSLMVEEARLSSDAALAQSLQHSDDAEATANRQFAIKLAASDRKTMLDAEYAKRLQEADDEMDIDEPKMKDAESVLGQDIIEQILASDLNDKGKGKRVARDNEKGTSRTKGILDAGKVKEEEDTKDNIPLPVCGICMDSFRATYSPVNAAKSANSSNRLPFGLHIPCSQSHPYCLDCLTRYIRTKLDPNGDGSGSTNAVVFPIPCPGCTVVEWSDGISDEVASRVLSEKEMTIWHHQRLLDSLPKVFCPNPKCSALVQVHDDEDEPQASCPLCNVLMCVPCRVLWHEDMSCEDYQALPLDERSPEDQQALQLAKAQNWRRCPKCAVIVELTMGCNHITCRCNTHFCFKCGSLWDVKASRCTRTPSCELWDEDMLLEERERRREAQANVRAPPPPPPPPAQQAPPPPYVPNAPLFQHYPVRYDQFDWMMDREFLCTRHFYTNNMISTLTCLYCEAKLNSLADLQYHLSHTRRHEVFACCGRFFKREVDWERHIEAGPRKWGDHLHQVRT